MTTNAVLLNVEADRLAEALQEAGRKLDGKEEELVLDFSLVRRIDPGTLVALEELARIAREKAAKVALRGVSVEIYRVLKLVKLASQFSFLN